MKAIFVTGGKQYLVSENDEVFVEKLDVKEKDEVTFDEVLMVDGEVGTPTVAGAKVVCEVVKNGKAKKIKGRGLPNPPRRFLYWLFFNAIFKGFTC